jgi:mRNA interferase MazF
MNPFPQRGEIWWISLDPTRGSEIKKTRPCLVISRDEYNRSSGTATVIPVTSGKVQYPAWEIEVGKSIGLDEISHLVLPQIRIAAKERFKKRIGKITQSDFHEIEEKLLFYLGFDSFFGEQFTIVGTTLPQNS